MNRDRITVWASVILSAAALGASSLISGKIVPERKRLQLTATVSMTDNLPPDIALTTAALGSFRGLAVDYLWYRANRLQDSGKYYEAIQLSDWITRLQPRFPRVWAFQAWNLAYNLSEAVPTPEEKWMWVSEGIRLLRDKAIPMNPRSTLLYRELAYILFHKVGKYAVGSHWYYKREFADEWQGILGGMPGGGSSEALEFMRTIAQAPDDLKSLFALHPELLAEVQSLREAGFELNADWLRRYDLILSQTRWRPAPTLDPEAKELAPDMRLYLWAQREGKEDLRKKLLAFTRKQVLKDRYHMDAKFMLSLMNRFGPMDYRHPAAHAVYWAAKGTWQSERSISADAFTVLQADRILLQGLQALAFSGQIHFDPLTRYYSQTPDPRVFDAFEVALHEAARRQEKLGENADALAGSHRGFLEWATRETYLFGNMKRAAEFYRKLRDEYEDDYPGNYTKPLSIFVKNQMGTNRLEQAQSAINALLRRAFSEGLALGRRKEGQNLINKARRIHLKHSEGTASNPTERHKDSLPPFRTLITVAFAQFLASPPGAVHPIIKARVWQGAPEDLKRAVYDRMKARLQKEATQAGLDAAIAFPEPSGMEEIRKRNNAEKDKAQP